MASFMSPSLKLNKSRRPQTSQPRHNGSRNQHVGSIYSPNYFISDRTDTQFNSSFTKNDRSGDKKSGSRVNSGDRGQERQVMSTMQAIDDHTGSDMQSNILKKSRGASSTQLMFRTNNASFKGSSTFNTRESAQGLYTNNMFDNSFVSSFPFFSNTKMRKENSQVDLYSREMVVRAQTPAIQ